MRKTTTKLFALFNILVINALLLSFGSILHAQKSVLFGIAPPTLGNYSATVIGLGGNTIVSPSAAPGSASRITATTSANFKGVIAVNPATGVVRITDASLAGVYTVTVSATNAGGTTTATFQLTVQTRTGCSPFTIDSNFTQATGSPFGTDGSPQFSAIGDFNNDGIQDVAVTNFNSNSVSILTGTGTGGFNAAVNIATGGFSPQFITVNDFNGDGNQDFAVGNINSNNVSVLLGDGAGGFAQAAGSPFASGGSNPHGIESADFDGDGDADLAVSNSNSDNVAIFLNNGTGGFAAAARSPITVNFPFGLVKGFFNGDANVDLAVVNGISSNLSILIGNGDGTFVVSTSPTANTGARTAAVADIDNDGDQDIVVDNLNTNNLSILLNNGTGVFTSGTSVNAGIGTFGITAADLDGDGNADILASQNSGSAVTLQRGNGDGTFTAAGTIGGLARPRGISVGDFNGDDRQDFAVVLNDGQQIASYLGTCQVDITNTSLPNASQNAAYNADIDATGGTTPYTFSATGLPAGLMIDPATGIITGMPTVLGTFYPRFNVTDSTPIAPPLERQSFAGAIGNNHFQVLPLVVLAPSAAGVSISGRVLVSNGRGLTNAIVYLTDQSGATRIARTSAFGYYRFDDLAAGQSVIMTVVSRRYQFTPQVVNLTDNLSEVNFIAVPTNKTVMKRSWSKP